MESVEDKRKTRHRREHKRLAKATATTRTIRLGRKVGEGGGHSEQKG